MLRPRKWWNTQVRCKSPTLSRQFSLSLTYMLVSPRTKNNRTMKSIVCSCGYSEQRDNSHSAGSIMLLSVQMQWRASSRAEATSSSPSSFYSPTFFNSTRLSSPISASVSVLSCRCWTPQLSPIPFCLNIFPFSRW